MSPGYARAIPLFILLVGAALRTVQYGAMVSLTTDEILLALNLIDRSWQELLFQPLLHDQVAPIGFLFLERLSVVIGGNNEAALKFFPYLFSLASLLLFWQVANRCLERSSMLASLIVFALSPSLVYFAGIAKQYSGDVMVTLLLVWMTLLYFEKPISRPVSILFGIAGGLGLLISHPAVLVACGLGVLLLVEGRGRGTIWQLSAICAGWSVGAIMATYASVTFVSPSTSAYMHSYWEIGFAPRPWVGFSELLWIPSHLIQSVIFFATFIEIPRSMPVKALGGIYGLLLVMGFVHLARRGLRSSIILLVPIVVAVLAAYLQLLPLLWRLSLFIGPSLLIGSFAGFDQIRSWLAPRLKAFSHAAALGFAILTTPVLLALKPPPTVFSKSRPVLQAMKAEWNPDDEQVTIPDKYARSTVEYYGPRVGIEDWSHIYRPEGLTAMDMLETYLPQIDEFRGGPRVWFYMDRIHTCEEEMILDYLDTIGDRLVSADSHLVETVKVSAYLYDLSDPGLLANASADTYHELPACARRGPT